VAGATDTDDHSQTAVGKSAMLGAFGRVAVACPEEPGLAARSPTVSLGVRLRAAARAGVAMMAQAAAFCPRAGLRLIGNELAAAYVPKWL
jgi:hypothetical protein